MPFFESDYKDREFNLELALSGIPLSNFYFHFYGDEDNICKSRAYLLLVSSENIGENGFPETAGTFLLGESRIGESPFGLKHQRFFLFDDYYGISIDGKLNPEPEKQSKLYLPLRLTDFKIKPREDFYHLLGINGSEGVNPLIFLSENEHGLLYSLIYKEGTKIDLHHRIAQPNVESMVKRSINSYFDVKVFPRPKKTEKDIKDSSDSSKDGKDQKDENKSSGKELSESKPENKPENKPTGTYENPKIKGKSIFDDPKELVKYLDDYVIGQDEAKRTLAVAFSRYMMQVNSGGDLISKENCLLIGPSGVGKTYLISLLAKLSPVPLISTKLSAKSGEGYTGQNFTSSLFRDVRAKTEGDAPYGIVFLDEIDKVAQRESHGTVFEQILQKDMIGWLEDGNVQPVRDQPSFSTKNLLFVAAGAFQGLGDSSLAKIISNRLSKDSRKIGFLSENPVSAKTDEERNFLHEVQPEDLVTYGFLPELIGRFPVLTAFNSLSLEDKIRILNEATDSSFQKNSKLLQMKGYQLEIDCDVPEVIAGFCPEETGARALDSFCSKIFNEIFYDIDKYAEDKVVKVRADFVKEVLDSKNSKKK